MRRRARDGLHHCGLLRRSACANADGGRFEAEDGTAIVLRRKDDPSLPPSLGTASMLRKTTYGVADTATLEAIAAERQAARARVELAATISALRQALGLLPQQNTP